MSITAAERKTAQKHTEVSRVFNRASAVWIMVIVVLAGINCWSAYVTKVRIVKNSAVDSFQKDTVYRHWATMHGGVYVPATEQTPPNPYLAHIPERDIVTPSGRLLTLVNPAYMTRQVHMLGAKSYGARGHITSLRPLRPQNAPDEWERSALESFENSAQEAFGIAVIEGRQYFRYMRPFIVESGCLKCHAAQGYRVGDIRGGISVSLAWEPVYRELLANWVVVCAAHALLGCLGLLGLYYGRRRIAMHLRMREQSEQALQAKNDELIGLNRMVSHDLKSPLITIRASVGWLEKDIAAGDQDRIEKSIHFISSAADSMYRLVEELLLLSSIEQEHRACSQTSLQELVREALDVLAGRIAQCGVRVDVADTPVVLYGNRMHLMRVFQNLLENAVKFMGDQAEPRIEIGAETAQDTVFVFVRDNGSGVESHQAEKIFEPFTKLDASQEGSGLGLALVGQIIKMHGGRIWVESEGRGRGACFRFRLPMKS